MSNSENKAGQACSEQRDVQREQRAHDEQSARAKQGGSQQGGAEHIQTGARDYPAGPLLSQQLDKPGSEASMQLKPQFLAPD